MTVRTAVVGAGTVSDIHLSGLDRCPHTTLTAVCDLEEDRARRAAGRYGIRAYTDMDALLAEESLDWLHLCTSVQSHLPLARKAIEAGVPVQIEKPITETTAEIEELQRLSERYDVPVTEVQQHLFDPAIRELSDRIEAGELGRVRAVDTVFSGMERPDDQRRGDWAFELAGGEFEEGLPHPIYLTLELGGFPRETTDVAATTSLLDDYERPFSYDGGQVQYVAEDGRLCSVKLVAGCAPQKLILVHGERRSVTADLVSQTLVDVGLNYNGSTIAKIRNNVFRAKDRLGGVLENGRRVLRARRSDEWGPIRDLNGHYYQIDREARAIASGDPMPVPLEQSWWSVVLMEALRDHPERERTPVESAL